MSIEEVLKPIIYFFCNILTCVINVFVRRDQSIILMGAWYGRRFAGNCRFLFQYLSMNKDKYDLKRVIWVTRSKKIYDELSQLGYEVYMMKSIKSFYYHFKAGIHAVSTNMASSIATNKKVLGDIMGQFSLGAVHVYLNHGITSIKGNRIRDFDKLEGIERVVVGLYRSLHRNSFIRNYILCPGGWDRVIYLSPGRESSNRDILRHLETEQMMFWEAGFPELCECLCYLKSEQEILNKIRQHNKTIFYLPTYRTSNDTGYSHPLNSIDLCDFLKRNSYYWIDKLHPGAKEDMNANYYNPEFSLKLDSDFDTNVLLREADVIITDYSSICHTAAYFDRPLIYYWPDHEEYMKKDKSIIQEFQNDIAGYVTYCPEELMIALNKCFQENYMVRWEEKYKEIKKVFFDNRIANYKDIAESLFDYIQNQW